MGGATWHDPEGCCGISHDWMHPGCGGCDGEIATRKWVSPASGEAHIYGNAHKIDPGGIGGNGVTVGIYHNSNMLWSRDIDGYDSVGYDFDITLYVNEGDAIYFTVHSNCSNLYDGTSFNPTIVLTPKNQPPVASFTYSPENPVVDQEITFDASSSSDPDGTIVKYKWDFGDGNRAEGQKVTHIYSQAGIYTVTLTVTDNVGATSSLSRVFVLNPSILKGTVYDESGQSVAGVNVEIGTYSTITDTNGRYSISNPRDYLDKAGYGAFKKAIIYSIKKAITEEGFSYTTAIAPLQTTVFPHSEASISSSGNNLYLTWLYDNPQRTSINRTMTVFSSWDGTKWSEPLPISDDGTADFHPEVLTFSDGSAVAVWQDEKAVMADTATFEDMVQNLEISVSRYNPQTRQWIGTQKADFKLASSVDGKLSIIWAEPSDYSSDLYAVFYDPIFNTWGSPKQLTFDQETERNLTAAFYGNDTIIGVYNRNQITQTQVSRTTARGNAVNIDVPVAIGTDLYMLKYTMGKDLALEGGSLNTSPLNPKPGTDATLTVKAMNLGDVPASNIPVAFYLGDPSSGGTKIGESIISGVLGPGEKTDVSMTWTVPETAIPLKIFAVIDPSAALDPVNRFNNIVSTELVKSDLTIKSVRWEKITDRLISITARVSNEGVIASGATTVRFKDEANNGQNLFTKDIGSLAPYESMDVNFVWDVSSKKSPGYTVSIVVDEEGRVAEFDEANNGRKITIEAPILGDINNDGAVNVLDVQLCINQALGVTPETSSADMNGDGKINVLDVQLVINKALGL